MSASCSPASPEPTARPPPRTWWTRFFREAGLITGLIGTIEYRLAKEILPAPNTTPESLDVMRFAAELEQRGGRRLIMEVSSHALALGRVFGIKFHTAVFTNLTRDHLDFHHTMEEYAAAKGLLFSPVDSPAPEWAVLNADDSASRGMTGASKTLWYECRPSFIRKICAAASTDCVSIWCLKAPAAGAIDAERPDQRHEYSGRGGRGISYGMKLETIARGHRELPLRGRAASKESTKASRSWWWWTMRTPTMPCGTSSRWRGTSPRPGDHFVRMWRRSRSQQASVDGHGRRELSDFVVLTSDNPRSEDPLDIMNDAMVGIRRFDTLHIAEPDRAKAIRLAIAEAKQGDVVLLAGKGHETYQY